MDRYGNDFRSRGSWQGSQGDFGRGSAWGEGRGDFGSYGRWAPRERGFTGSNYDQGWRSQGRDTGFGGSFGGRFGGYGSNETGGYHPGYGPYGAHRGGQGFEHSQRNFYDREMFGRDRWEGERDHGFGDRLRHGWDRVRDEAREWMGGRGRGYDRGW